MLAAACTDVLSLAASRPRSELAVLLQQASAPAPVGQQFYAANSRTVTRTLVHTGQAGTVFAVITFPPNALATVGGQAASSMDSTLVTAQPMPGTYGVDVVANATFSAGAPPTVRFLFGSYGDVTGSRAGSRYASNTEYAQALTLWREESFDRFSSVTGSGPAGIDAVSGSLSGPGSYLLAAVK